MKTPPFDFDRTIQINPSPFKAFDAGSENESLAQLIETGDVNPNQPLIVIDRSNGVLALDRQEMSFHHVAQGELHGEPWMIAF